MSEIVELTNLTLFFLFLAGFGAGLIDSIAGGGGIITLPALLWAGVPPHFALATNKLQSSFGSFTATLNYTKRGLVEPKKLILGILFTFIGATLGSITVQFVPSGFLADFTIIMLTFLLFFTYFNKNFGLIEKNQRINPKLFYLIFGLLIGFYDGFFGPGTGSFWTIAIVFFLGLGLKSATAQTKIFNFTSNIVSLSVFLFSGLVLFEIGIVMGIGQIAGAYLGSTFVAKKDTKYIRYIFLAVVLATIVKLAFERWLD